MNAAGGAEQHFVDKWWQREPEMRLAEVFCPPAMRPRFRAWGALLRELRESMFELSDPGLVRVKTAWWAEEALAIGQGRPRHPLGAALPASAPWQELARTLVGWTGDAPRASDTQAALADLAPFARALVAVESALFADAPPSADASVREDAVDATGAARALAMHWLLHRLPRGLADEDQARLPMHLLARHGLTAAELPTPHAQALLRDWAAELLAATPTSLPVSPFFRRCQLRLDRRRLARLAGDGRLRALSPLDGLWQAWRAARGA